LTITVGFASRTSREVSLVRLTLSTIFVRCSIAAVGAATPVGGVILFTDTDDFSVGVTGVIVVILSEGAVVAVIAAVASEGVAGIILSEGVAAAVIVASEGVAAAVIAAVASEGVAAAVIAVVASEVVAGDTLSEGVVGNALSEGVAADTLSEGVTAAALSEGVDGAVFPLLAATLAAACCLIISLRGSPASNIFDASTLTPLSEYITRW
jgi:hypothetical protein